MDTVLNEYNDHLSCDNIRPLIDVLESFVTYKHNHNTSYSAVTMYWSAANIAEKFQNLSLKVRIDNLSNLISHCLRLNWISR